MQQNIYISDMRENYKKMSQIKVSYFRRLLFFVGYYFSSVKIIRG